MSHFTTPQFWDLYNALPRDVRDLADGCFALLQQDPSHPSLRFKKVGRYWYTAERKLPVGRRSAGHD